MVSSVEEKVADTTLRELFVECECGTHLIKISSYDDEDDIYVGLWVDNFYNKQSTIFQRIGKKIKLIWKVLTNKDYLLEEIILNTKDTNKLISLLQTIVENKKEGN